MKTLSFMLTLLFGLTIPCSAHAEAGKALPPPPVPGVEWTKIQDLRPDAPATNSPIKQKWAVVIGAGKFKEKRLDDEQRVMDTAARHFYDYLIDPHGGRFAPGHVRLLLNSEATRQNIMSTLGSSWLGSVAGPDDLVTVFIATNGFPTTDGSTYLCAYDCAIDNVYSTCISMQTLMDTLRHNVRSNRIVLVLQACYSGAAELTAGAKALFSGYSIDLDKVVLGKGYIILSSSKPNEMTWSDIFSRNLVKALRQENGLIRLSGAFAIAQKTTQQETSQPAAQGKIQTPQMKSDWSGNDLVLGAPPVEQVSELPEGVINFLSAESYYLKATNLVAAGDFDGAIKQYEQAIVIDPKYADALADCGAVHCIKGDLEGAAQMYRRAIATRTEDGLFHANYARILDKLGKPDEAKDELELAYRYSPKDKVVLTALATRELAANHAARAAQLLGEAVALYPGSSTLHERLSFAFVKAGDTDQALAQAQEAVKLDPKSASAKLNLGSALMLHGDSGAATAAYSDAVILAPQNPEAHYLLSRALEGRGDLSGARAELGKVVSLCAADDPRAMAAKKHLSELEEDHSSHYR